MTGLLLMLSVLPVQATELAMGTYGRGGAATDLSGGEADTLDIVTYASRIGKGPYAEIDFVFVEETDGATFRAVLTPAFAGQTFHYTGEWDADVAVRNLFAEATGPRDEGWNAWAGARMWRGDDVYLWDFWPMDNLNLVGAGGGFEKNGWELRTAIGLNRLTSGTFQQQSVTVQTPGSVASTEVEVLDRQRTVAAFRVGRTAKAGALTLRGRVYTELHRLPEGQRTVDARLTEDLPADRGLTLGTEWSMWGWSDGAFAHVWYRHSRGLAAFSELGVPERGYAADGSLTRARTHLLAVAGNHETERYGILWGAWLRSFKDADETTADWDDRVETAIGVRPSLFIGRHGVIATEFSHQRFVSAGLIPQKESVGAPALRQVAVMPGLQLKPGQMSRPWIHLTYAYGQLNDDARWLWPEQDPRFASNHHHRLGVGVEWWFDSASYRPGGIR